MVYIFLLVTALYDSPQILQESEYILKAQDNHTIFCQGNKPLKWTVPETKVSPYLLIQCTIILQFSLLVFSVIFQTFLYFAGTSEGLDPIQRRIRKTDKPKVPVWVKITHY